MFELMLCSLFTLVPDYLYRRYGQGKRIGKEITLFSMWYELRWGITGCVMLTVLLITLIFYYHPSTSSAALFFRTVPVVPETPGRVAEVNVDFSAPVKKGTVLFTLDSSKQRAAVETAKRKIAEVDAQMVAAKVDVIKAAAQLQQANSDYKQAKDELDVKTELQRRSPGIVPQRDIEKLQVLADGRVVIESINRVKKHQKPNPQANKQGGIIEKEMPLAASKVAIWNPSAKKGDRVGIKILADGKRVRFFKSNGEMLDV